MAASFWVESSHGWQCYMESQVAISVSANSKNHGDVSWLPAIGCCVATEVTCQLVTWKQQLASTCRD